MERSVTFRIRHPPLHSHHVTLCFAPKLPLKLMADIWNHASKFPEAGPLPFTLGPVEALTSRGQCRLFLRRVHFDVERVRELQGHIKMAMQNICAGAEAHFSNEHHITVARVCGSVRTSACRAFLSSYAARDDKAQCLEGVFDKLCLMQSTLTPTGAVYTTMHERAL